MRPSAHCRLVKYAYFCPAHLLLLLSHLNIVVFVIWNGTVDLIRFASFPCTLMQNETLQLCSWMYRLNLLPTSEKVNMRQRNQSMWCFTKCLFILVCQHCKENEERPSCDRGVWWRCSAQKISQWNCRPQATTSRGKCHHSFFFFSSVMLCLAYHCKFHYSSATDLWMTSLQVSSVTQTTATEKEVLSQLLQEKDQLQREQEDRIRNLTELLVTSSNQVPVQKVNVTQREAVVRVQLSLHYHSRMTLVLFLRCQNAGLRGEERCSDLPVRLPVMVVHLTSALQNLSFGRGKQTVPVWWSWVKVRRSTYVFLKVQIIIHLIIPISCMNCTIWWLVECKCGIF